MLFLSKKKKKIGAEHPEDMIPITKDYKNKKIQIFFSGNYSSEKCKTWTPEFSQEQLFCVKQQLTLYF